MSSKFPDDAVFESRSFQKQIVYILQHVRDVYTNCLHQYCHKKRRKKQPKIKIVQKKKQSKDKNKQTNKQILSSMETSLSYF